MSVKLANGVIVQIAFQTMSDAFNDPTEISHILTRLAKKMSEARPGDEGSISDSNGNTVGSWSWKTEKDMGITV